MTGKLTWLTIRNFGKVKYFNVSYYVLFGVPILAYAYEQINNRFVLDFEFPYNLKVVFASSLSYVIAITLYYYFCPNIIKEYEKDKDYVRDYRKIYHRAFPDLKLEIVLANLNESQNKIKEEITALVNDLVNPIEHEREELQSKLNEKIELVYPGCVQNYLLNDYANSTRSNPFAIYVSGFFYLLGTAILLYTIIIKSIRVFSN